LRLSLLLLAAEPGLAFLAEVTVEREPAPAGAYAHHSRLEARCPAIEGRENTEAAMTPAVAENAAKPALSS